VLDGEGAVVDLDGDGLAGVLGADVDALLGHSFIGLSWIPKATSSRHWRKKRPA
jgi:hypothetical protein